MTLDRLPEWVAADAALVRRGRYLSTTFLVEVGDTAWLVTVHEGRVTRVERGPFLMREWAFAIRASAEAWRRYWEPVPAPGFHDLFALTKGGHGPGVFKGDLFFYRGDGDFRDRVAQIDTAHCPLYLLTGEYDFSCTPEDTERTAAKIKGARVTIMREIGHFPMSENPAQFRRYILPVLEEIRARG